MSEKEIKIKHSKDKLPGLQLAEMDICGDYILRKHN